MPDTDHYFEKWLLVFASSNDASLKMVLLFTLFIKPEPPLINNTNIWIIYFSLANPWPYNNTMEPKCEAFSSKGGWTCLSGTVEHGPLIIWVLMDRAHACFWAGQRVQRGKRLDSHCPPPTPLASCEVLSKSPYS